MIALLVGQTDAADRVYKSRLVPVRENSLPAISVYTDSETVDDSSMSTARELTRQVTLSVDAFVKVPAEGHVDDAFDAIALQIETALDADLNFNSTAFNSVLSSTEFGQLQVGDKPMGCVHMEYSVIYHTGLRIEAPEDDFSEVDVNYTNLGSGVIDPDDQAEDLIEVEE